MKNIVVIGSSVCDVLLNIDHLPKTEEDIHISSQKFSIGGCAFNSVHAIKSLNVPYTFISCIGKGAYGEFVKAELAKENIKTNIYSDSDNGCCYCFVESNHERTFVSYHGVEYRFKKEWLKDIDFNDVSYTLFCGLEVEDVDGDELVDTLIALDTKLVFAPGPRLLSIKEDRMQRILKAKPIMHLNEKEILAYTKNTDLIKAIKDLYDITKNTVIVTCGDKGCLASEDGINFMQVDSKKTEVVNTVGAGDSHVGALLGYLTKGYNMYDALKGANEVSSFIVASEKSILTSDQISKLSLK